MATYDDFERKVKALVGKGQSIDSAIAVIKEEWQNAEELSRHPELLKQINQYAEKVTAEKAKNNIKSGGMISYVGKSDSDSNESQIWDIVSQVRSKVPNEEWEKLPKDLARNFDSYQQSGQGY